MTEQEFEAAWLDVCSELRMSMDGVYFEAAVLLAKKAEAADREACAKVCESICNDPWADVEGITPQDCADAIRMHSNELSGPEAALSPEGPARTQG